MNNFLKLLFAWLLVAIPLAWGVTKSVQKALPLFRGEAKSVVASPN